MLNTEISPDVAALVDRLKDVSIDETVRYIDLSNAIGRDVRKYRWLLTSAFKIAARDHGVVFGTERGVGYTRLPIERVPDIGHTARRHVRQVSRRSAAKIRQATARANNIPAETQRKLNAELSVLALIEHAAGDKAATPTDDHEQRPEPVAVTARRLFA